MLFRFLPFRPPNIEPILAAQAPLTKTYGALSGFLFGFSGIVVYDFFTSGLGIWTWVTASAYGALALGAAAFFAKRRGPPMNYGIYAVIATIAYDALTGLTIGPLSGHQTFMTALVGQIPFTALHLLGNVSFAIILSSSLEKMFAIENQFNFSFPLSKVRNIINKFV